ncbi:MAG: IPT/TIG domain-containing protein, partial [Acidimicrobiales bacterium]
MPDTDGADFYDVQVNDTGGGSGPYETGFPYSNDVFFDGNVTWTAPSGFHQIPMAELFGHDCASAFAGEAGRYTLLGATAQSSGTVLQGQVTTASGAPVAGAPVSISGPDGLRNATTSSSGWYLATNVGGLTAGAYVVSSPGASFVTKCSPGAAASNSVCDLTLSAATATSFGGGTASFTNGSPQVAEVVVTGSSGPPSGPIAGGTNLTITGAGFGSPGDSDQVQLVPVGTDSPISATQVVVVNSTTITAVTGEGTAILPAGQGSLVTDVEVTAAGVTSAPNPPADTYTYFGAPVIDSVEPAGGPLTGGNDVVITGSGFMDPDLTFEGVVFDPLSDPGDYSEGIDGTAVDRVSDTEIDVTAPDATVAAAGATSLETDVTATFEVTGSPGEADDSVSAAENDDSYVFGAPVIDSVEPAAGPLTGGNDVVITGSG